MEVPTVRRVCVLVTGLLIIVCLFFVMSHAIGIWNRNRCNFIVGDISLAIRSYCEDYNSFPPNLMSLVHGNYIRDTRALMCPAVHPSLPNGAYRADYTYINWSNYFDTPNKVHQDFPVVYDRALSNHGGSGINIGRVDGGMFWDPGATWLRHFAASHPEYDIPVPK